MILEHPVAEPGFGTRELIEIVEGVLKDKNWKDFEIKAQRMYLRPYYFFNYDCVGENIEHISGRSAIDAVTGEFSPFFPQLVEERPINFTKEIEGEFELLKPAITKQEAKDVARIKVSSQLGLKKEDVVISGVVLYYWPVWSVWVSIQGDERKLDIDGVFGTPLNFEDIPEREPTWGESAKHVFTKMKKPSGWFELSKKMYKSLMPEEERHRYYVVIAILIILILLALLLL